MTLSSHMGNNYPWHKEETHFYDDDNHYLKIGSGVHSVSKIFLKSANSSQLCNNFQLFNRRAK